MIDILRHRLEGKKILLLGFGREGESSYRVLRKLWPRQKLWIADRNPDVIGNPLIQNDPDLELHCGENYLDAIKQADVVLKSPGISLKDMTEPVDPSRITSQTDLFLEAFAPQVTGITGTKGKSTTSSLIAHILALAGKDTILVGNIGTPAWHFLDQINPQTCIVDELSSHQLEYIRQGPHIGLLLNIFEEHLDAYASYRDYQMAKLKIAATQTPGDFLIYNADDPILLTHLRSANRPDQHHPKPAITEPSPPHTLIPSHPHTLTPSHPHTLTPAHSHTPFPGTLIPFSLSGGDESHAWKSQSSLPGAFRMNNELVIRVPGREELIIHEPHNRYLKGEHNLRNIMAAVTASWLQGATEEAILDGLASFKGLAHRMETLGCYHGIYWVNDSIATIPEACMAAVQSLPEVETLILGGFDRGISYEQFARFLLRSPVRTLILNGDAGRRIGTEMEKLDRTINNTRSLFYINRFDDFLPIALKHTRPGTTCLLSPAASSYDEFRSFEERGFRFRELIVKELGT